MEWISKWNFNFQVCVQEKLQQLIWGVLVGFSPRFPSTEKFRKAFFWTDVVIQLEAFYIIAVTLQRHSPVPDSCQSWQVPGVPQPNEVTKALTSSLSMHACCIHTISYKYNTIRYHTIQCDTSPSLEVMVQLSSSEFTFHWMITGSRWLSSIHNFGRVAEFHFQTKGLSSKKRMACMFSSWRNQIWFFYPWRNLPSAGFSETSQSISMFLLHPVTSRSPTA